MSFPVHCLQKMCAVTQNAVPFPEGTAPLRTGTRVGACSLSSRVQLLGCERSASSVFTTDPAKLMVCLQVSEFFNSSPATLAGIRPRSFLLDQLCSEFVELWHVVSVVKQTKLSIASVLHV